VSQEIYRLAFAIILLIFLLILTTFGRYVAYVTCWRCSRAVELANDMSRVQIPARPLSRNIGQLSLASLRGL